MVLVGLARRLACAAVDHHDLAATVDPVPNISAEAICFGYWSTVLALKICFVPSA